MKYTLAAVVALSFLFTPTNSTQALKIWPGGFPIVFDAGGGKMHAPSTPPKSQSYRTRHGDMLRTPNYTGVLDRFGITVYEFMAANPGVLMPICVRARTMPDGMTICREIHYYLPEGRTVTIPSQSNHCGGGIYIMQ